MSQKVSKGCVWISLIKLSANAGLQIYIHLRLIGFCTCWWLLEEVRRKKKVSVFVYAERCAPHVGTMYGFRTGCKLCQVNTTWEQTAAGRHLKRNSVLCLGLKSSDDLLKVTLLFVMTSLSDQCRGETSNQWTLIPKNLDWKWGGNIYNFWFFLDDWSLSFFLFMTFLWAFFFSIKRYVTRCARF